MGRTAGGMLPIGNPPHVVSRRPAVGRRRNRPETPRLGVGLWAHTPLVVAQSAMPRARAQRHSLIVEDAASVRSTRVFVELGENALNVAAKSDDVGAGDRCLSLCRAADP